MLSYLQEQKLKNICQEIFNYLLQKKLEDFQSVLSILQDKNFVKNNQHIFSLINLPWDIKKTKTFLSHIMIVKCPEDVLGEIKETEKQLQTIAEKCNLSYLNFLENSLDEKLQQEFRKNSYDFLELFESWRTNDKKKMIVILASSHYDLTLTMETIENTTYEGDEIERAKIWIEEIKKQEKSLERAIYQIGGEEALEQLYDGTFWLELMTPEFREKLQNNLQKAFYDKLQNEIEKEDKPFLIIKTLQEIRNLLGKCVPSREDIQQQWDKKLQIELLNNDITLEQRKQIIVSSLEIFVEIILELESKERNEKYEIVDIVDGIKYCYEKIRLIFHDIQIIKEQLEKKYSK